MKKILFCHRNRTDGNHQKYYHRQLECEAYRELI